MNTNTNIQVIVKDDVKLTASIYKMIRNAIRNRIQINHTSIFINYA